MGWRPDRIRTRELRAKWLQLSHPGHLSRRHPDPRRPSAAPAALPVLLIGPLPPDRRLAAGRAPRRPAHPRAHRHHAACRRHRRLPPPRRTSTSCSWPRPRCLPSSPRCTCRRAAGHPGPHVDGGVSDLVPITGAADLGAHPGLRPRCQRPRPSFPAGGPRSTCSSPASGVATASPARARPRGPAVSIHRMTTPDLGARMTDFSFTGTAHRRRPRCGRAAGEAARAGSRADPRSTRSPRAASPDPRHRPVSGRLDGLPGLAQPHRRQDVPARTLVTMFGRVTASRAAVASLAGATCCSRAAQRSAGARGRGATTPGSCIIDPCPVTDGARAHLGRECCRGSGRRRAGEGPGQGPACGGPRGAAPAWPSDRHLRRRPQPDRATRRDRRGFPSSTR